MAQYEPIGIKSGFPTNLGTDTLRADLSAVAGLTTAAPAAGDACQLSGALTITPAVNTSANPVVGIYDGVTGSVVRRGVVVASFVGGLTLAAGDAVYLSSVAGRLTNVKPTTDNLHEVGVVVSAAASTIMLQIKPVVVLPATMMMFDARSSWLLQGDTPPAYPGEQQPFPSTAASLITALGATGVILPANVLAIYQCATASPLTDSLGLGPNLVAAGGPLTGRECVGLPGTSFNSKIGVEFYPLGAVQNFAQAVPNGFGQPNGGIISVLMVWRNQITSGGHWRLVGTDEGFTSDWWYGVCNSNGLFVNADDGAGGMTFLGYVNCTVNDGAWHCVAYNVDDVLKRVSTVSDLGNTTDAPGTWAGTISDATGRFHIGGSAGCAADQVAYMAVLNAQITSAMRQSFWRAYNLNEFNTPVSYTRTGSLVAPISASRVACYGPNQPAVGFNSNFAGTDNLLKTGIVVDNGIAFLGITSNNLSAWLDNNTSHTAVDGPSGMVDATQVTMTGLGWDPLPSAYLYSSAAPLVGATNVPFWAGGWYKQSAIPNGTTARLGTGLQGDPGGNEWFDVINDAASPAAWTRGGGTFTPTRAAHTTFYGLLGATALNNKCDWAEIIAVQNYATAPLAWCRTSAVSVATSAPVTSITNVGNVRYSPVRGKLTLRISGYTNPTGPSPCFVAFGAAATVGAMYIDGIGGLRFYMWDNTPALPFVLNGGAITSAQHEYVFQWNSAAGTASISEGGVVLASYAGAAWTPGAVDVTPLYIGMAPVLNSAFCNIALVSITNI